MEAAVALAGTTSRKRSASGQEEEGELREEPKRPRDGGGGDEEEAEMVFNLSRYRRNWSDLWSDDSGDVDKRTESGPMRYTEEPVPRYATPMDALEVFSFEVMELNGAPRWPIDVFGFISVRDSLDRNRNYIFERTRDDSQTLTAKDSSLVLTGPSHGVLLIDPIELEIELRIKGKRPSEDKILSTEAFEFYGMAQRHRSGSLRSKMISGARSTLEFRYAHLPLALEATVKVRITGALTDFCGKFTAHTASINQNVTLLDSGEEMVAISNDGTINLSRNVVLVEGKDGLLTKGKAKW